MGVTILAENMQSVEQRPDHLFRPGSSGNPRGRESKASRRARCEDIVAEWAAPFGGPDALTAAERQLALLAAELTLWRPRRHEDMVRQVNTVGRLLAQAGLANKHDREPIVEEAPSPAFNALDWLKAKAKEQSA
jgi:hypothetical protein